MKPHTAPQARLDSELAGAVRDLADRVDELAEAQLQLSSQALREARQLDRRLAALELGVGGDGLGGQSRRCTTGSTISPRAWTR